MWFLIVYLMIVHGLVLNAYEKLLVQSLAGNHCRPTHAHLCAKSIPLNGLGMPSGHTEVAVIISVLLLSVGLIHWSVAVAIVFLVGLQRILWQRHTLSQVLAGFLMGSAYAVIYLVMIRGKNGAYAYVFPLLVACVLIVAITLIIDRKVQEPVPSWVDPSLHAMIDVKRDISFVEKVGHVAVMPACPEFALYCPWDQLEENLDELIGMMSKQPYDVIIGIKSGGAIISNYVAQRLYLPNGYVKLAKICQKSMSETVSEYVSKAMPSNRFKNADYHVCEHVRSDLKLEGKRVLLIDELINTGETILATKRYLLDEKKAGEVTMACLVNRGNYHTPFIDRFVGGTAEVYVVWPWGYGN